MTENKIVIVTGLTRIWAGITNIAKGLSEKNVRYLYYYQEKRQIYTQEDKHIYDLEFAPIERFNNLIKFYNLLRCRRPAHVEVYHHLSDPWLIIFQLLVAKLLQLPTITVCTGGEILYWKEHGLIKKLSIRVSFLFSGVVILKELHMRDSITKYGIGSLNKTKIIYNSIPVQSEPRYSKEKGKILFLNTFKPWRNLDLIINAAELVVKAKPTEEFYVVGLAGKAGENEIANLILNKGLNENVHLLPFTKDPKIYYESASMFLLPADVVFCNNALLEAMERGVPPIVSDVQGSELIVEHLTSGIIVRRNAEELANAILLLLENEELRVKLAKGARKKIETDFNEKRRTELLFKIYRQEIWK